MSVLEYVMMSVHDSTRVCYDECTLYMSVLEYVMMSVHVSTRGTGT